ncbi:MAG TPA: hypothetical protein DCF68_11540, partial [Cyanothece sp. UBA12306]|nr:hypothetical protein [Cyanothece sp. UBA12306]
GADLRGANLSGADLIKADLRRANLIEADLSGAEFTWADLGGPNVTGTIFTDSKGINNELKLDLIQRGAIFNDSPGNGSSVLIS